ncbi:MAG: Ig-like domain-containing protein [Bacteroidetes bacterium]|nr:Ig-like domain-containing protein [Bacteroidota bacterium]
MKLSANRFLLFVILFISAGCANIVPPEGGKKDTYPPKLKSITPGDSLLNTRVSKIEMHFNEFVTVTDVSKEIQISPLLTIPISALSYGKRVVVKIPDSLLQNNTTYRISFGNAIKDVHEGNVMKPYTYQFSTGSYFDSLELKGTVYDAATGLPDGDAVIALYDATKSDSAVVKEKPSYITKSTGGNFYFSGLPAKKFRIYAMHDANNNLVYDGKNEKIAFLNRYVKPADSSVDTITLKVFEEPFVDTALLKATDRKGAVATNKTKAEDKMPLTYVVQADTSNINRRTFDVTKPLIITFSRKIDSFNKNRIFISYDSSDITIESAFDVVRDSVKKEQLKITVPWKEDALYTVKLLKGFATDSIGNQPFPGKFAFRTQNDDDYAKLEIHLPSKYHSNQHMLMVCRDADTIHNKPVADTVVKLSKLVPGDYKMRIIVDKNRNGKWDTGNLFEKIQPEDVIPYMEAIALKAGWDNIIDFEPPKKAPEPVTSPEKRDKPQRN